MPGKTEIAVPIRRRGQGHDSPSPCQNLGCNFQSGKFRGWKNRKNLAPQLARTSCVNRGRVAFPMHVLPKGGKSQECGANATPVKATPF